MFEGMVYFHNYLLFFMILIGMFVMLFLYKIVVSFNEKTNPVSDKFTHSSLLEIVWTIIPAGILLLIAIPSFALLYSLDELIDPVLTLKIIGHQWYWTYEYSDYVSLEGGDTLSFDSYMVASDDLLKGSFRLLEVDNRIVLPINSHIRLLVTAADVLHSWTIPSFGVKLDACPGRLSQASLFIKREGVYYGQCSEICGVNHGFMPIVVKGVSVDQFTNWIAAKLEDVVID
jgi:cytochrome c oxidase subunit 2